MPPSHAALGKWRNPGITRSDMSTAPGKVSKHHLDASMSGVKVRYVQRDISQFSSLSTEMHLNNRIVFVPIT